MSRTAYALLIFNPDTKEILGWGTFSADEGNVTCSKGRQYARLTQVTADSYQEACDKVIEIVKRWSPGLGDPR